MANSLRRYFFSVIFFLIPVTAESVEDWKQFLGPDNSSIATTSQPPVQWTPEDYAWETEIPGKGWSSPVYSDNRIWITTALTEPATEQQIEEKRKGVQYADIKTTVGSVELRAICLNLENGEILHQVSLAKITDPELVNPLNSYASPTPAIANGNVICHFGNYGTWCLDSKTGETIWKTKFVVDHSVGPGSSPVIYDNKVIIVCDGIDQQFVVAVDLKTGDLVWQTNRPEMRSTNGEYQKAYCTPLLIEIGGATQAIIPGAQWIAAYDPDNGKEIWRIDHGDGFSVTPMASLEDDTIVFSTGYMRAEIVAVDPTGEGDVTESNIKWRLNNGPNMPSMITTDGKAYVISDRGILSCIDTRSGELLKRKRIGGNFSATPLLAGGHIYLPSREGLITVVRCDPNLEVIGKNKFADTIMASLAPVGDDLLVRTGKKIYRVAKTN